jgi:dCMP deaminase
MNRISWDEYFCEMAKLTAKRSSCLRRKVGAVIVKNNRVIATGYNAQPVGKKECTKCSRLEFSQGTGLEICTVVHAEVNAITQCALQGISCDGATLYVTTKPCIWCLKTIINAGIKKVIFIDEYHAPESDLLAKECGMELIQYKQ